MRKRVEDLGRISVLIRNLLDHQIFEEYVNRPGRPKDASDWFSSLSDEKKYDVIHAYSYGIEDIEHQLYAIMDIADGTDMLNEREDSDRDLD